MATEQQDYCDWCQRKLTDDDRDRSIALGLDRHMAWACQECIDSNRIAAAPEGWNEDSEWPPRT